MHDIHSFIIAVGSIGLPGDDKHFPDTNSLDLTRGDDFISFFAGQMNHVRADRKTNHR